MSLLRIDCGYSATTVDCVLFFSFMMPNPTAATTSRIQTESNGMDWLGGGGGNGCAQPETVLKQIINNTNAVLITELNIRQNYLNLFIQHLVVCQFSV